MKAAVCVMAGFLIVAAVTQDTQVKAPPAAAPFWSDLGAGPYAVGFRVLYERDPRRPWHKRADKVADDPGRPIRMSIWYPAVPSAQAKPMAYGDYLHHGGPDDFRELNDRLDKSDLDGILGDFRELSPPGEPAFDNLLSTPAAAYANAPPAPGRFPLVLYSGGKASRADANVELGEYLASYGYIVATVPQLGPSDQELELGSSPREISLHADDFDSALATLARRPQVDLGRGLATAGHSAGGEVAVELALRHAEVTAAVGLDGSYGTSSGTRVLQQLPEYVPGRPLAAALLDLRRADGAQGVKLDLNAIDALHWADIYRVIFAKAFHGDFTEWGMIAFRLQIPMPPNPDGHTRQVGLEVNEHSCQAVRDFLDARLRERKDALPHLVARIQQAPGATFSHVVGSMEGAQKK